MAISSITTSDLMTVDDDDDEVWMDSVVCTDVERAGRRDGLRGLHIVPIQRSDALNVVPIDGEWSVPPLYHHGGSPGGDHLRGPGPSASRGWSTSTTIKRERGKKSKICSVRI